VRRGLDGRQFPGTSICLGFQERIRGSHHLFFESGIEDLVNIQRSGSKAKPYQVRQIRTLITRHGLGGHDPA
jgi:hypothetical protein